VGRGWERALPHGADQRLSAGDQDAWRAAELVQPVFLFELSGQIGLGQVAEVLVGERVELVLEPAREHPLDLFLPRLLPNPAKLEQLLGPVDVLVVELDADVARQAVAEASCRPPASRGAGAAAAYPYLTPVLAAAFAWLFLGEPITAVVVVCGVVIAAGVYLLNRA
jgi:hypothetical protein